MQDTTVYFLIQLLYQLTLYNHKAVLRHGRFEVIPVCEVYVVIHDMLLYGLVRNIVDECGASNFCL